jgi:hypothetical protein
VRDLCQRAREHDATSAQRDRVDRERERQSRRLFETSPEGDRTIAELRAPTPGEVSWAGDFFGEIGLFNEHVNRSALVRLPSGRFVRVSVGDRLDGGRVAAIGESSLQYVINGRNVTLEIPG